jgi:hypothetical protein
MRKMVEDLENTEPTYSDIGVALAGKHLKGFTTTTTRPCWAMDLRRFSGPWRVTGFGRRTVCRGCRSFPMTRRSALVRPSS